MSDETSNKVYVCPNCQQELQKKNDKKYFCNSCNSIFNIDDWLHVGLPSIFTNQEFRDKVLSSKGLVPVFSLFYKNQPVNLKRNECYIPRDLNQELSESFSSKEAKSVKIWRDAVKTKEGFILYQWKLQMIENIKLSVISYNGKHSLSVNEIVDLHKGDIIIINNIELEVGIKYETDSDASANTIFKTKDIIIKNNTLSTNKIFTIKSHSNINSNPNIPSSSDADIIIDIDNSSLHINIIIYYCSKSWWIYNDSFSHGDNNRKIPFPCLIVNGESVNSKELFLGDKIEFAGKSFKFMADSLIEFNQNSVGPHIRVENLTATRENYKLFSDISFEVKPGEFIGILGHSGGGKSSLIHRLAGLVKIKPNEGEIKINNGSPEDYRSESSYIHQYPALHDTITVIQECRCFAKLHTVLSKSEIDSHINSVLNLVNLKDNESKPVHLLSGGEKKRLSLALELLREPKLLILDEPTSGLDPANEKEIMEYLRRLADQGKTVICSTHMMNNVELFHKVLILRKTSDRGGVIDCYATPKDALVHYNVSDYSEIYQCLLNSESNVFDSSSKINNYALSQPEDIKPKQKPIKAPKPNRLRQIGAYIARDWYQFINFWYSIGVKEKIKDFFFGDLFFQWILQPTLIALCIRLACNGKYFAISPDSDCPGTAFFFCLISIFWLGMNNGIRELVSERYPGRCLERLKELPLIRVYLTSKIVWCAFLCFVQTIIFCYCLFTLFNNLPLPKPSDGAIHRVLFWNWTSIETIMMIFILWFMCFLGSWISLAISATVKKESVALSVMPLVLIPLLLFSYPVMQENDKLCNWGKFIERCLPCKEPQAYLEYVNVCLEKNIEKETSNPSNAVNVSDSEKTSVDNPQQNKNAKSIKETFAALISDEFLKAMRSLLLWALLALIWMIIGQKYNEEHWEGR